MNEHMRSKRRGLLVAAASATLALGMLALFIAVAAGSSDSDRANVIDGFGLTMQLPEGWDGRVYQRSPRDAVTVEAASVTLAPKADDSFQQTEASMGASDAFIWLSDIGSPPSQPGREPTWKKASLPITISASDVHRYVEGHSLPANVARPVLINGRPITLYVGFGSWPNDAMIEQVNKVLASLSVSARNPA